MGTVKTAEQAAHEAISEFVKEHAGQSLNDITEGNKDLMDGFDMHFDVDATWFANDHAFGTDPKFWGTDGLQNIKPEDTVDHLEQRGGSTGLPVNLHWRIRVTIELAMMRGFTLGRKFERETK